MAKIKPLKVAIIGCGRIGAFTRKELRRTLPKSYFPLNHCEAVTATPGFLLVAVCDIEIESARKAAALHGAKTFYTDFKKMILEQSPDIVTIATRTAGRTDIIQYAASHGVKGIYMEKPLSTNMLDATNALKVVRKKNVAVGYGTSRRYMPVYREAKKILQSGRFGKLLQIGAHFGATNLMWSHPHSIDLIHFYSDSANVDYVQSSFEYNKETFRGNTLDADPVIDFAFIKYKNGISGLITSLGGKNLELTCEKGKIIITDNGRYLYTISGNSSNEGKGQRLQIKKGRSGICEALVEIRNSIIHGKKTSMTAEDILTEQNILLALGYSGTHSGQKTKLLQVNEKFTITGRIGKLYP